ncbi:AraC family transcriptional regulator [Bordetella petrii]|uniref:AraC family transcriptional regulator n=1 Tax=Bordetella petrii TaxID=94624 RepID=UPI001A971C9B|nr:helix-turn-helix transcriptional regulator [Bordetella petrii]MBO1114032.1 helix-turn-helix domain-containing protein [Bordetella petrii]
MASAVPLSSKLDLIACDGYALAASRQPGYVFDWHVHDCAMLLWPRTGALDSAWQTAGGRRRGRLARGQALLLPAQVPHSTRSTGAAQQHGELYLAANLLRECPVGGPLQLDGAAQAMLDALWMPALAAAARASLVRALIGQLAASRALALEEDPLADLAGRWFDSLRLALEDSRPLPAITQSAARLGVSVRTLQRACLQEYGLTPLDLRRTLLAQAARARLAGGESLASVSAALGFANSGHLGRLLRAVPARRAPTRSKYEPT